LLFFGGGFLLTLFLYTIEKIIANEKKVTVNQAKIINAIKANPYVTQDKLSAIVGIARKNIIENMKKLQQNGLIKRV